MTIQLDEMWLFVGSKANKQWVWLAINADSREIVGVYVGARSRQEAKGLWQSLQGLYVHPGFGRCGIGSKILAALEQEAALLGLSYLKADASINAEAFYRKQGFEVIEYGTHQLASGQKMTCVKMRKTLRT